MTTIEEATAIVLAAARPLGAELDAHGRAVGAARAQDVVAAWDLPPLTTSAMDGYAVRAVDVAAASAARPVRLRVRGRVLAGAAPAGVAVAAGEAVAIMTGGEPPPGADAVVRAEVTVADGDDVLV